MIDYTVYAGVAGLLLCGCLAATAGVAGDSAGGYDGPKDKLHVYLLIGDSNMAGGADLADEDTAIIDRCYLLNSEGKWEPARAPLNRYSSIEKEDALQKLGPGISFAKAMLKADKTISIGLVVNAAQDAAIDQWGAKTKPYWDSRKRSRIAQQSGILKGVLWYGGGTRTQYPNDIDLLKDLIARIRLDQRFLSLPFVMGELPDCPADNEEIKAVSADVHATGVASSKGLKTVDKVHYDAKSMKLFGECYAEQMLKVQAELAARKAPQKTSAVKFIDTHVHAQTAAEDGLDGAAKWMEMNNVERCIIHPLGQSRPEYEKQLESMLARFGKYKGKIERFCLIYPDEVKSVEEAVKILKREKADGAIGFGEHYGNNLMFDDPKNMRIYEACEKVGLPVMFHIDQDKNMDEAGLPRVEQVLKAFPKCILIAHAGWWGHLPDGTCDRLLREYPNLYADTSPGALSVLNRDRKYTREFLIRNADKILFGTDAGWWSLGKDKEDRELEFDFFEELDLPDEVRTKIYRANAEKLFGFSK